MRGRNPRLGEEQAVVLPRGRRRRRRGSGERSWRHGERRWRNGERAAAERRREAERGGARGGVGRVRPAIAAAADAKEDVVRNWSAGVHLYDEKQAAPGEQRHWMSQGKVAHGGRRVRRGALWGEGGGDRARRGEAGGTTPARTAGGDEHVRSRVVEGRQAEGVVGHEEKDEEDDDGQELEVANEEVGREGQRGEAEEATHVVGRVERGPEVLAEEVLLAVRDRNEAGDHDDGARHERRDDAVDDVREGDERHAREVVENARALGVAGVWDARHADEENVWFSFERGEVGRGVSGRGACHSDVSSGSENARRPPQR